MVAVPGQLLSYDSGGYGGPGPTAQNSGSQRGGVPDQKKKNDLTARAALVGDTLGRMLQGRYDNWVESRRWVEEEWLRAVRAYHGVYDGDILAKIPVNGSKVFVQLTRMKTDTAYNRICDMMLGTEDHWDLKPSPKPQLQPERSEELREIIEKNMADAYVAQAEQMLLAGATEPPPPPRPPTEEELERIENDLAAKSAKRMKLTIRDQLEYANYRKNFRHCTFEMCVLGTGVFKGPMVGVDNRPRWVRMRQLSAVGEDADPTYKWELSGGEEIIPKIDSPSLFDIYPDPYTSETQAGLGVYERHVLQAHQLEDLAEQPGFLRSQVEKLRREYPQGNHWENYTDLELRLVSGQQQTDDAEMRYDVVEYWGWVTGSDLRVAGETVAEDELDKSFYANVWHCGGITIKAVISDKAPHKTIYRLVPYKEVVASQYGHGVPYLMKDSQESVNSAGRELINNAAMSSGPQVEIFVDLIELDANESVREIKPWRTYLRSGGDMSYPAVRFTNIPNNAQALTNVLQIWRAFADEETNIPSYAGGQTGQGVMPAGAANKTASGMSMLMGAASLDTKGVVKNQDQYLIKPFIEDMYHFNMFHSDDEQIKGDMEPEATGSSSLMAKEIKSQRVMMMLQLTNNPIDLQIMGLERRAKLWRAAAESVDINPDDVAPDPDEESMMQAMGMPVPGGMGAPVPGEPAEGVPPEPPIAAGQIPPGPNVGRQPIPQGGPGFNVDVQ